MKQALRIGSAALALISIGVLSAMFLPAARTTVAQERFAAFPVDQPKNIALSVDEPVDREEPSANVDERQRRRFDQARDWTLLAILQASGASPKEINEATYDLPVIRNQNLRRVSTFDYGPLRSRVLPDGQVVALVPNGLPGQVKDDLGKIADRQRTELGSTPPSLALFQYDLNPEGSLAGVTRRTDISGDRLFSEEYGYVERELKSIEDMNTFLAGVDDLTWIQVVKGSLHAGGRRRLAPVSNQQPYGRIGLQEVAAVYRGQQGLEETRGVGFSLDPRIDMNKAQAGFDSLILPRLQALLAKPELVAAARQMMQAKVATMKQVLTREDRFRELLAAACDSSSNPMQCLKDLNDIEFEMSFQTARYEGQHLAGTEVGMVLFYTDLLMKLWSFDFEGSAPRQHIRDFPVQTEMRVSSIYQNELERAPGTRLWLGSLRPAYLISEKTGSISFARNATRIFAHAHSFATGQDAEDPEPNILNRLFIDWWNDHFEEIARYEPQYERLNQIMKWSVVISWLESRHNGGLLWYLGDSVKNPTPVMRVEDFPLWAKDHNGLAFHDWGKLNFDKPTAARGENESLDLVSSKNFEFFGKKLQWQGGVETASRAAVEESAAVARGLETIAPSARRAALNGNVSKLSAGRLEDIRATEFVFNNYSDRAVSTLVRARPSERLRSAFGELENVGFNRDIRSTSNSLLIHTRAEGGGMIGDLGSLRISRASDGMQVNWMSRDISLGQSLGRRVSMAEDATQVLMESPEVDAFISLGEQRGWLVRSRASERWIKLSEASKEANSIQPGYQARVAGFSEKARPIDVGWINKGAMETELRESGYITVSSRGSRSGVRFEYSARPPPSAGAKASYVETEGTRISAIEDAGGRKWVRVGELPKAVREDPARLAGFRTLNSEEMQIARHLEAGEYQDVAQQLARDSAAYRAHWQRVLENEVARNDRLILDGQYRLALDHAQQVLATHGQVPDFIFRKALLETADAGRTANTLGSGIRGQITNPQKFFNEVNYRIEHAATTLEKDNSRVVAQFVDWQGQAERSGSISAFSDGGRLQLKVDLSGLPKGRVVSSAEAESVIGAGRPVYLAESPLLNNLDPHVPISPQSLRQLVSSGQFSMRELQATDIATFKPMVIRVTNPAETRVANWRLIETSARTVTNQYNSYRPSRCDDKQENCHVYVMDTAGAGQK